MSFFQELKRRNVFRMGIAYVVVAWVALQAIDFALEVFELLADCIYAGRRACLLAISHGTSLNH